MRETFDPRFRQPKKLNISVYFNLLSLMILSVAFLSFSSAAFSEEENATSAAVDAQNATENETLNANGIDDAENGSLKDVDEKESDAPSNAASSTSSQKDKKKSQTLKGTIEDLINTIFKTPFNNFLFLIFLMMLAGYLIGRIKIFGLTLGVAGVFFVALLFGYYGYGDGTYLHKIGVVRMSESALKASLAQIQDMGLLCFIASVGFVAGPRFFVNLKRNIKSYALVAVVIVGSGALSCMALVKWTGADSAMMVGILSGALTTTPGFAAAQDVVRGNDYLLNEITVGHAIGYPFGVLGIVFFVQLVPLLLRANIEEEQKKMNVVSSQEAAVEYKKKLFDLDPVGLVPFCIAIILGAFVGRIVFPLPGGASFSLGTTGGTLLAGLLLGHYGRIGSVNMRISKEFARTFREFGLSLFLIGAGAPGGANFVAVIQEYGFILFVFGALMGTVPMLCGFFFARKVLKLCLFNSLGSITGGMTSTPGLGALINTAKTEDVAAADAATYPVALILVVIACQQIVKFM